MHTIKVRNVNFALTEGLRLLHYFGSNFESRAGNVVVADGPVATVYLRPQERVLFNAKRDANPFFHFFESLWMLGGRNDVAYMEYILPSFTQFSDDGEYFHGAYGKRWRDWFAHKNFPLDQLTIISSILKENPMDRRCVLTMWDPETDLGKSGKDFPCNTHIYFSRQNKEQSLDMTVCCRSNDIIWGAYGANAVHMSVLQEYMAAMIGCPIGLYWQVSNNYHAYENVITPIKNLAFITVHDPYESGKVKPFPLVSDPRRFNGELEMFLDEPKAIGFRDPFFRKVALPLWRSFEIYKSEEKKRFELSIREANTCMADDWRAACVQWLERRYENSKRKNNAGSGSRES